MAQARITLLPARHAQGEIAYPGGPPLGLTQQEHVQGDVLLCQAHPASPTLTLAVNETRPPAEVVVKALPCRVERSERLTPEAVALFLRLPAVEEFTYLPGQYVDLLLEQNRCRSFSLANAPGGAPLFELHVGRAAAAYFSERLFGGRVRAGMLLRLEGSLGQFWFRHEPPRPALIVGGTGYAPVRAMLDQLLRTGRAVHPYWGVSRPRDLYEHERRQQLAQAFPQFQHTPVISDAAVADAWTGRTGLVHAAALADHARLSDFDVDTAWPPALVEAAHHEFVERGLPVEQLFFDSFDYSPEVLASLGRTRDT